MKESSCIKSKGENESLPMVWQTRVSIMCVHLIMEARCHFVTDHKYIGIYYGCLYNWSNLFIFICFDVATDKAWRLSLIRKSHFCPLQSSTCQTDQHPPPSLSFSLSPSFLLWLILSFSLSLSLCFLLCLSLTLCLFVSLSFCVTQLNYMSLFCRILVIPRKAYFHSASHSR